MNDPIIKAPISKIVEAIEKKLVPIHGFTQEETELINEALASLESSEREVLVNYADWFEDNKHNLVGETIGYAIDRYLAEKHKTVEK